MERVTRGIQVMYGTCHSGDSGDVWDVSLGGFR